MAQRRLGRIAARLILQTPPARSFISRAGSSTALGISRAAKYTALAGVMITPGIWWLTTTAKRDKVPRLDSPPTEHLVIEPGPSPDEVTRIISQEAYSFRVRDIPGVDRYDGTQLAANSPCEDNFTHGTIPSPWGDGNNRWMTWAVFDGHAGWQTADLLKKHLLPFVRHSLSQAKSTSGEGSAREEDVVQRAIRKGFVQLDDSLMRTATEAAQSNESLQDKVKKLTPAYSGSCALLSMYDPVTSLLHVACTGDSRAILGRKRPDGKWEAVPLSVDQSGNNSEEADRLNKEHPGEDNMIKDGRVLGMMVSRAFGDAVWKWPLGLQIDLRRRFYTIPPLPPRYDFRTPPYLTAEPVVTTTKIDSASPSFLIMATDGLWYMLSSQQAVNLVGKWIDSRASGKKKIEPRPEYASFDFSHFGKGMDSRFVDERLTVQDDNAAVHLLRNILGGNHHEMIAGRLAYEPSFARRSRDDITVQVAFFNSKV